MKAALSFKVDPDLKKALETLAEQENRSLSNYVITQLKNHVRVHLPNKEVVSVRETKGLYGSAPLEKEKKKKSSNPKK